MSADPGTAAARLHVRGIVQGVGFRPFVHATATRLGLAGSVANGPSGVVVEVEGDPAAVDALCEEITRRPPALAVVERVERRPLPAVGRRGFAIVASALGAGASAVLPPDAAPCTDCLAEIRDPAQRRHRYPFTNCTACGPRYTIVRELPYDRERTTMEAFPMCAACAAEHADPGDRRFHAQPVCCPACGPVLSLRTADGGTLSRDTPGRGAPRCDAPGGALGGDPLAQAVRLLQGGGIVAVKGVGGYHLACDARDEDAVARLRARKHREERPFAVLVADLDAAAALCAIDEHEAAALTSPRRPIVLLARRPGAAIAGGVAPGNRALGLLLPPTPLHQLLADDLGRPLVLTSGNVSSEPIVHRDEEAGDRLGGIADAFLVHDRPIAVRVDDSVVRVWRGAEVPLRRARGYAPAPLALALPVRRPVLACGAELKSTFCLAAGNQAVVSQHLGDLEHWEALRGFTEGVAHLERLLEVAPEVVAHDLHPDYLSTRYALEREGVELVGVQHHHAHIASCLADHGAEGPVIGVALDGTGYGTDGTVWGGELLVADLAGFQRAGHLSQVRMPGGAAAVREPWRMAAAWADAACGGDPPEALPVRRRQAERFDAVLAMARSGLSAPLTSSAGRLFDAVAALLGVRDVVTYEGQAAIELEQLADLAEPGGYPAEVAEVDGALVLPGEPLVRGVLADQRAGLDAGRIAMRFHRGLSRSLTAAVIALRERTGLSTAALSGGVFQNVVLLELVVDDLEGRGFTVLTHRRVPCNDGGISLGQAAVAAARDRAGPSAVRTDPPGRR